MINKLIVIVLVFLACITYSVANKLLKDFKDHNPIFDSYAKGFPSNIKQIPIVFADEVENAGTCHSWFNGYREIEINRKMWNGYSDSQRRWLIWHELGHCELSKDHVNLHINADNEVCIDNEEKYKCRYYTPLSIMRWYVPHARQIPIMCKRKEIDKLSRLFCDNIGL